MVSGGFFHKSANPSKSISCFGKFNVKKNSNSIYPRTNFLISQAIKKEHLLIEFHMGRVYLDYNVGIIKDPIWVKHGNMEKSSNDEF